MGTSLHIENLHYNIEDFELADWFAQYGTVRAAKVIRERQTARSGWVEMSSEPEAEAAALALNGKPKTGRILTVKQADPQNPAHEALPPVGGPWPGGFGDRSGKPPSGNNLS